MEQEQNSTQKNSAIKTLAVIGFAAVVVGGVWLAVQTVQHAPTIFTNLASLAESVYGPKEKTEIVLTPNKALVNDGEVFELSWKDFEQPGEFFISYDCVDDVTVAITNDNGDFVGAACNELFPLGSRTKAHMKVSSGGDRFEDVPFTISFKPADSDNLVASNPESVTVVNATIPETGVVAGASDDANTATETDTDTTPTEETASETNTPPSTPAPAPQPQYVYEYEYALPESDPNGFTDLDIQYLGVGKIEDGAFVPEGDIDNDDEGAVRFSVKNLGTKTSDEWTYEVLLPSGFTYKSNAQKGLKPNETATIVLGFTTDKTGIQPIEGTVTVDHDRVTSNNDFSWSVTITS